MMDKQVGGGRWFYRLLPLGCFLAGRPVVDVAVIHVALSVSGPLCLQRESPGGSCWWESGAWEEALFELRVLKMVVVHHASSRPMTLSRRQLPLDLLMQRLLLMRRGGFLAVSGSTCIFLDNFCGRLRYSIIVPSPSWLTESIFWLCHVYVPRRSGDASFVLALSLRVRTFVLFIQRLLWPLRLERHYFGNFWVRAPCFAVISRSCRALVFNLLTMHRVTLSSSAVALWERIDSRRSFKSLRYLLMRLILTMPRISADRRAPLFVRWRSIPVFVKDVPP